MQDASQIHGSQLRRATGIAVIASFVVSLTGFFAAGLWGDNTEPYNESRIAVVAWETFLIAGATFIVLFIVFVVLAALDNRRSDVSPESAAKHR